MLSMIVPVYNEEKNIRQTVAGLKKALQQLKTEYEIIVVNDGSTDGTLEALAEVQGIRLISYPQNSGKGYALKTGLAAARGTLIGYIDGDGEIPPAYLADFYAAMQEKKCDIAVGRKVQLKKSLMRKGYSLGFHLCTRLLFGLKVETQTGLKLFSSRIKNFANSCSNGYIFDLELLIACHESQLRITEVPVVLNDGKKPNRIKLGQAYQMLEDMISLKMRRATCTSQESYGYSFYS